MGVRKKSLIKAILLTNGSLLHLPEVRSAASQVHTDQKVPGTKRHFSATDLEGNTCFKLDMHQDD
ncbi:hypothetical protein ACFL0Q_05420 [Thermodesulfobacteriota bacterium]